jgi:hypothetical protein
VWVCALRKYSVKKSATALTIAFSTAVHCKVKGQPVSFIRFVWVSEDGIQFSEDQIRPGALNIVNVWQIEVPSVVFCQLPDDGKAR